MADRRHRPLCRPPEQWSEWVRFVSFALHGRSRWRLVVVMTGMLLASGRRTVTSWLRAVGVRVGYEEYYYFISSIGRNVRQVSLRVLALLLKQLTDQQRVLLAIDDTPTRRYGPHVEGAGLHHNPTTCPDDHKWVYGHLWVTLAWVVRHRRWHAIAFPFWAQLYIKRKDVAELEPNYQWQFATKLQLAAKMLRDVFPVFQAAGKRVWAVADGAYFYRPFLREVLPLGITVVSRLRRDASLRTLPTPQQCKHGRRRKYGKKRISVAKRAAHPKGWQQIECTLYGGKRVTQTYKTFLATYRLVGGVLRVVIVKEADGWEVFGCTDPDASVADILEAFADRSSIEQCFWDVKEIWGAAGQQVRNLWCNIGCFHLNMWSHTLTELWAWRQRKRTICDRSASPWDDTKRRPSHNDRRKALRRLTIQNVHCAAHVHRADQPLSKRFIKYLAQLAA